MSVGKYSLKSSSSSRGHISTLLILSSESLISAYISPLWCSIRHGGLFLSASLRATSARSSVACARRSAVWAAFFEDSRASVRAFPAPRACQAAMPAPMRDIPVPIHFEASMPWIIAPAERPAHRTGVGSGPAPRPIDAGRLSSPRPLTRSSRFCGPSQPGGPGRRNTRRTLPLDCNQRRDEPTPAPRIRGDDPACRVDAYCSPHLRGYTGPRPMKGRGPATPGSGAASRGCVPPLPPGSGLASAPGPGDGVVDRADGGVVPVAGGAGDPAP